jgi:hypothetical protein
MMALQMRGALIAKNSCKREVKNGQTKSNHQLDCRSFAPNAICVPEKSLMRLES